jgi:hypothetical protein
VKVEQDDFAGLEAVAPDLLPNGAVPMHGVVLLEYVDSEGETDHAYHVLGDVRVVHLLGLLETAKWLVLNDAEEDDA